ncbi:hypothetical protein K2X33_07710 [bacterium]|nr:hypothetical protein [bacterium]
MFLRTGLLILCLLASQSLGGWGTCAEELAGFSKQLPGKAVSSKWNASGWKDPRFPQAASPNVTESRFYGYGYYGRYYKARVSLTHAIWVKEFLFDYQDTLRRTPTLVDLPTREQLAQSARSTAENEEKLMQFLGKGNFMPYGVRAAKVRGLATPTALRYGEPLRGRTVSAILNDSSIDLEHRQLLWKRFQESLFLLQTNLTEKALLRYFDEIEGFGMQFEMDEERFSVTICGTLWDPDTEEFVIIDPNYFD